MTATESDAAPAPDASLSGVFRIDSEGVWRHEGVEVTHPGVLRNLYANLRVEGEAHHLQVGSRRIPVEVDDAPFVVVRAEVGRDPTSLTLHLSDGSREPLDPRTLSMGSRGIPYCRVEEGRFRARFSVAAWLQLARHIEDDPRSGELVLILGGRRITVPRGR
jgi:hypothetical protein